ncbi:hypothetical protein MPSEU_000988300 [Mayamaea pseudoterrestris]|nr:hypothetical protein MPSEU_000988300 [Mayamaea pseudoterrestris]
MSVVAMQIDSTPPPNNRSSTSSDAVIHQGSTYEEAQSSTPENNVVSFAVGDKVYVKVQGEDAAGVRQQVVSVDDDATFNNAFTASTTTTTSASDLYWSGIIRRVSHSQALVHPYGPKSSSQWDEWIPFERLEMQQQHGCRSKIATPRHGVRDKENSIQENSKRKAKRKSDDFEPQMEQGQQPRDSSKRRLHVSQNGTFAAPSHYFSEQDVCFALPFTLRTVLVDEYEAICGSNLRHDLPAAVSIDKVLDHFCKEERKQQKQTHVVDESGDAITNEDANATEAATDAAKDHLSRVEFCNQLRQLFHQALPVCLLYPQERRQYDQILAANDVASNDSSNSSKPLVQIYGCEYLLRLVLRLPLLGYQHANNAPTANLLSELLALLQKNRQACFGRNKYRHATTDEA